MSSSEDNTIQTNEQDTFVSSEDKFPSLEFGAQLNSAVWTIAN